MESGWITTSTALRDLRDLEHAPAWESFVGHFRRPIARFALGLGLRPADAEDVAQETLLAFAEAFRSGRYDRAKGRLGTWLFGIAYRQVLRERRRLARRAVSVRGADDATTFWARVPAEDEAESIWDRQWEEALLQQCLERVQREIQPTTYRAFELVVLGECPAPRAAEALGVPVTVVYNAKHRVLRRIRELREEIDRPDTEERQRSDSGR